MKFFDLPPLDPATLVGYQEDHQARKRFERRFRIPTLAGVLLLFGTPVALFMGKISEELIAVLVPSGFLIIAGSMLWMFKSRPISSYGLPMAKYWNCKPKPGHKEIVYVCGESKTWFIRVWGKPSGPG